MSKWEYMTVAVPMADLSALGGEGWELVAIDGGLMFFKRPASEDDEKPAKRGK